MSKEIKIVKMYADKSQDLYVYENSFLVISNLVNAVVMEYFGIKEWWSDVYKLKMVEIKKQIIDTQNFYIWADREKNITFVVRKIQSV